MVERKEKKSSLKLILLGFGLAAALPIVAGLGVKAYEKHVGKEVIQERFMSRLENISWEDVEGWYNRVRIEWEGEARSFFERAEGFFEYMSEYLKHL